MDDSLAWFAGSATIALVAAVIARRLNVGFALPVLAVGAVVGSLPVGPNAPLHPEVVLVAVLAPLVFGEALGSSDLDIRRVSRPVLALAVGLVVVTTATVGFTVSWATSVPLALGIALGAILA
ncbi:MAG: cation:proton antiporter, partial [Actinomycetales bacterium]